MVVPWSSATWGKCETPHGGKRRMQQVMRAPFAARAWEIHPRDSQRLKSPPLKGTNTMLFLLNRLLLLVNLGVFVCFGFLFLTWVDVIMHLFQYRLSCQQWGMNFCDDCTWQGKDWTLGKKGQTNVTCPFPDKTGKVLRLDLFASLPRACCSVLLKTLK